MGEKTRTWAVAVDVRCLQDPNYARRGVGRHALALLRGAPATIDVIGIFDPDLPSLSDEARGLLHRVCPNAYAAEAEARALGQPLSAFVSLSPMTHDPLFAIRLIADQHLLRVAVVYDFIPRHDPAVYLPGPVERLRYASALQWLGRFDIFAPISHVAAEELRMLFGAPEATSVPTGASLDPCFETVSEVRKTSPQRHLLAAGGGDKRKNPEVVIRAHARSFLLQRDRIPLVIAGNYSPQERTAFCMLAEQCGGDPLLLHIPGHVSDEVLLQLYAQTLALVCPSRDEGFSLPVVESMAASVPTIVSDIPAHRELVTDPALRFPPEQEDALIPLLERAASDAAWRAQVVAGQAGVWPRFRGALVAQRFWKPILRELSDQLAAPPINRGCRPRIAMLSPLPPDRSGVADYTATTCIELGKLVDLDVFSETEKPHPLQNVQHIIPLSALPHLRQTYDRVVSVIGNSHFHLSIFNLMRRYGSACIAHDARMIGFYRYLLGEQRALDVASRELGREVTVADLNKWVTDEGTLEALFLSETAESAAPSIVHSPVTAEMFKARYGVEPAYLPFSIYRPWAASQLTQAARRAARDRLGFGKHQIVIATFGFVQDAKAPADCVWALDLLRGWGFDAYLHFVGATYWMPDKGEALRALIGRLGLYAHVAFAEGFVPEQTYQDYLLGSDLGVQLRTYALGGLSGGLLDCAAAGLRSVTNASLGETVGVPASYIKSIPDGISPLLLAEALADLLESGPGEAALETDRQGFSEERSFSRYARKLCQALEL